MFGGLDYNNTTQSSTNTHEEEAFNLLRSVSDQIIKRGGFDPLEGTKQEIIQIKEEMVLKHIICDVYEDDEGTEGAFKSIVYKPRNIVHIATHSMYVPKDSDMSNSHLYRFIINEDTPDIDEEVQALSRSFLVMSGGNKLLYQDSIPAGVNDGILTALEISHLDFTDLDLVTLSACQTGLGTIGSEGVFGLQRAFKKAGANTILMSLDKVDDEATRILMVEFYRNLMKGKTKHQSLQEAQQYLRKVDNGKYDDPKYWASFIMLDGLN